MEIRRGAALFEPLRGSGPRTIVANPIVFPRSVSSATAGLTGYFVSFPQSDRDLGRLEVGLNTTVQDNVVTVEVTYGLRDWSGDWDDEYQGLIEFVVFAELEPAVAGPTREDLIVTGMEYNQATQFFRSAEHLDPENVQPDNSIPLVAGKTTIIRVYVDYDAASGLPPISLLSGQIEVITPTTSFFLAPISFIVPRRDHTIDRAELSHTLNFVIDEQFCTGTVTLKCSVFDLSDASQISAPFTEILRFVEVDPLRIHMVAVEYTGQGLNLPAPTQADFQPRLWFIESTYPIGQVLTTGYTVLNDFDADMETDEPCAAGFDELLDQIRDLQGDSDDIYCGVLPNGVKFGKYSGCGKSKYRTAMASVTVEILWAHEIGHAFARQHAPCDFPSRCNSPRSVDSDYPRYANYASDSIGEFGVGISTAGSADFVVKNPLLMFDFMGYTNTRRWISPHTYLGLMQRMAPTLQAGAAPDSGWNRVPTEMLFLDLTIDRHRKVSRRPSFHFPALALDYPGTPSSFEVEILDDCRRTLRCRTLEEDRASCGTHCWPKRFYEKIPFPDLAKWLVVWEGRELLYEECIPDPPRLDLTCRMDPGETGFQLVWHAEAANASTGNVWFLVQWEDVDRSWRGLMPRTQGSTAFVPRRLFGRRQQMRVRVLATTGIATGSAECTLVLPRPDNGGIRVILTGEPADPPPEPVPIPIPSGIARVTAFDSSGRTLADARFIWFDERGREIGRGRSLDLRRVPDARRLRVMAAGLRTLASRAEGAWRIERTSTGIRLWPESRRRNPQGDT